MVTPNAPISRRSPSRKPMRAAWAIVAGTMVIADDTFSITDRDLRHDGEDGARQRIALPDEQPTTAVPFGRDRDLPVAAVGLHRRAQRLRRPLLHLDQHRR